MWELTPRRGALLLLINLLTSELQPQTPNRFAIVIDEILADPTPVVGLPNTEFIELKNVSDQPINLKHWKISDGSGSTIISIDYLLRPDSFVVICSAPAASYFAQSVPVIGVSNFPSLNNDEDLISLYSPSGKCIHAVPYNASWFNNAIKSEGGWTLEMIDTRNPCSGENNWKASIDHNGGSPGRKNSVDAQNPDKDPPAFIRAYVLDSTSVIALFSEPLDSNEAANQQHYTLDDPANIPTRAVALPPLFKEVQLKFSEPLRAGKLYQLLITGITDCSHNSIGVNNKRPVGLPTLADSLDVVINEILFNPPGDGVDYLEILNRGKKIIDLSRIYLANRTASGMISAPKKLSEYPYLFFPGDYLAISESNSIVQRHYFSLNPDALMEITSLPSFPDDRGVALVLNETGKVIDELKYEENWHFQLLQRKEGVALERIDPSAKTQWRDNWTSAASAVGYGTPGLVNSQLKTDGIKQGVITIDPLVFSPDNDGVDDLCFIRYEMLEPNCVANIWIYDIHGREIRRLYNNITLAANGTLRWDGLGNHFKALPLGVYILCVEIFNVQGNRRTYNRVVTLARRF